MQTPHIPNLFPTPTKPSKRSRPKPPSRIESALKDIDRQALVNQLRTTKLNNANNPHNLVTHEGITQPLSKWAKQLGVPYNTLKSRYDEGWRGEELLCTSTYMHKTKPQHLEQT